MAAPAPSHPSEVISSNAAHSATGLPPGPRGRLLQTARYMRDPLAYTQAMTARYGDPFLMPSMNGDIVLTSSQEAAREILAGREEDYVVGFGVDAIKPVAGENSLLLLSGERHQRERKVISPPLHGNRMRAHAETMRGAALREIARWRPGERFSLQARMQRVSLEVILRVVFGVQSEARVTAFGEAIRAGIEEVNPLPLFFKFLQRELGGFGPWARFQRRRAELVAMLDEQIAESRRHLADLDPAAGPPDDVLSRLLLARYEDGSQLPDAVLRDQLLTLVIAGHETTATALAWGMYELLRQPELMARARGEVTALGPDVGANALAGSEWLDAFCRETLRAHPIVAEIFRTLRRPRTLMGRALPAGVHVAASVLMIHRDPELYPEPERFRPERFLERKFAPHEFVAFGGGHRHCVGAALALHELKIVLATMVTKCELALAEDRELHSVLRHLTLGPEKGVPVVVRALI